MDDIKHYGVERRSGRYPWGSGENPFQRTADFLAYVDKMRGEGLSDTEIASEMGISSTSLRSQITLANNRRRQIQTDSIISMKERGLTNTEIASNLGITEGTVRNRIKEAGSVKLTQLDNITRELRMQVEEKGYLDVGVGVERQMGISREKLNAAVNRMIKEEGYSVHNIYVKRLTDRNKGTTVKTLTLEPDMHTVKMNSDKIRPPEVYTDDGGLNFSSLGMKPIQSVGWDRLQINYAEDGGADKDGLIEIRRGVDDLDLGTNKYAQVRIGVNDSHYLKGMAVYSDDLPNGVDIRFNTNKKKGTSRESTLKPLKSNPNNPFGTTIKRDGQKGAINIVNEEGDWADWSNKLSAQFLSKQPTRLVKERLDHTMQLLNEELAEIQSLTNPIVKRHLLEAYSDGLGAKARHIKAQGMPGTRGHVLLPFPDMDPTEVYAPNYKNGEKLVLIRYPHGGIFELPELTVNNRGPAKSTIQNATDAIGIHPSVAQKLSGADFDGDTVWTIPNNNRKIKTSRSLQQLKNFDPIQYKVSNPPPINTQTEMGMVSNLITDMTIKGASQSEIARAVKHSMVVIDAEKHGLDHKQSAIDNGYASLRKKYQSTTNPITGKDTVAASTIVSRSRKYDRETGSYLVDDIYERDGKLDTLSSGEPVEKLYVNYMNKVKGMQNTTAKEAKSIPNIQRDSDATKRYAKEVKSLDAKLNTALLNAPRERQAQILATKTYYENLDYDMDSKEKKRLKSQALAEARVTTGAKRQLVEVTDKEWEAIQNNAISNNKLEQILKNTDIDRIKELSMPRQDKGFTSAMAARAQTMLNKGYTYSEVAEALGTSTTTLQNELK